MKYTNFKKGVPCVSHCVFLLLFAAASMAHANLNIISTFGSSITNDANFVEIEAGINAAVSRVQNAIANDITVKITFESNTSGLGSSNSLHFNLNYGVYVNALQNNQTLSPSDVAAIASLHYTSGDPNPVNGDANINVNTALAKALGIVNFTGSDGTITLNTSIMNLSRTGPQNSSFYDLQAVAAHEIDEVLGIGGPGTILPTLTGPIGVLDLFRYSAPNTRSFTTSSSATAYFSIDGGVTDLVNFNQAGSGSDYADWKTGTSPQVQDAFATPGTDIDIASNELTALDVVGYDLAPTPEPSRLLLLLGGAAGLLMRRRRN